MRQIMDVQVEFTGKPYAFAHALPCFAQGIIGELEYVLVSAWHLSKQFNQMRGQGDSGAEKSQPCGWLFS